MNKKGQAPQFMITNMIIAILTAGLFISLIGYMITDLSGGYDITGYNEADLAKFNKHDNLSITIKSASQEINDAVADRHAFDFLSDIFSTLTRPFKAIYQSFSVVIGLTNSGVETLELNSSIGDYFIAVLTVIVIIGFVMFRIWLGRQG